MAKYELMAKKDKLDTIRDLLEQKELAKENYELQKKTIEAKIEELSIKKEIDFDTSENKKITLNYDINSDSDIYLNISIFRCYSSEYVSLEKKQILKLKEFILGLEI